MSDHTSDFLKQYYDDKTDFISLSWSPYFHYGIFDKNNLSLEQAQENTVNAIINQISIKSSDHVLDLGCSNGLTSMLVAKNTNAQLTGVDISPAQVANAEENIRNVDLGKKPLFIVADANKLPFPDESFDAIVSFEVFCHLIDLPTAIKECARVLKKNGRIAITDLIALGPRTKATELFYTFAKQSRPPLPIEEFSRLLALYGFNDVLGQDLSSHFAQTYRMATQRLNANKNNIIDNYGYNAFAEVESFYQTCLKKDFLKEIGWASFIAKKA